MAEAYIVDAVRTAGGRRNGRLVGWHPADLAALVIDALNERTGIDPGAIEDVILGCVSQTGDQSANVARNAVLASRLPITVPAVTIDRQCGSSQQAIHFAAMAVISGVQDVVIAGGVESMTRVPMFSPTRLAVDAGLGSGPYSPRIKARFPGPDFSQFIGAEMIAQRYGFSRDDLDLFALDSHRKAAAAADADAFADEIVAVEVETDAGTMAHRIDEGIRFDASLEAIRSVKPLHEGGAISAANASQICDGASAAMIVSEAGLKRFGLRPIARIVAMHAIAGDPVVMLDVPLEATRQALAKAGLKIDDIDLFEVNEAFACVPLAWLRHVEADPDRLNVNGGAIALGHPLGASGTKLMATLVHALRGRGGTYGLQTMCEGGGMANVTIVERL